MEKSEGMPTIFSVVSVMVSLILTTALIITLSWPVTAEIPLSICIFIQLMAFSGYIYDFLQEAESMVKVYALLKEESADSHSRCN